MEFKLAEGERILKTYDCATVKTKGNNGKQTANSTLVVTNRRVVQRNTLAGKKISSIANKEIPVSAVKFVDVSYTKMRGINMILFLALLSLLAAICFIVSESGDGIEFSFLCLSLFCFFVHFIMRMGAKGVTLEFVLATDIKKNFSLSHGATSGIFGKRSSTKVMNVTVDEKVALVLVQELGAVILNAQNDVCPPIKTTEN